jgi:diaminohydroxyphosphoribosylaminopyrimidine deaminase/5-amino-6-(5-phosphoribosylamino)uracil reductase
MTFSESDHLAMARALVLAERGLHTTTPNPRVGCVLVKRGEVVGEGWHQRAGAPHAEVVALEAAGPAARNATAFVTLEPCSHFGRTPPCAEALIAAGVTRVVAAMADPNPLVSGRGMERLRASGVQVETGLLEQQARALNPGFISRMTRGRPWLRLKAATTLDGKTALNNGTSQWITGPEARRDGQRWRARACAILTGIGTVRADNPRMTVREIPCERQPLRVLVDARLEVSPTALLLDQGHCLVACAIAAPDKVAALREVGVEVLCLPDAEGRVDLPALLRELARRGCNEIHAEAGVTLNGALLRDNLVDELLLYVAPMLVGDDALGLFGLPTLTGLEQAVRLDLHDVRKVGSDLRIIARPVVT